MKIGTEREVLENPRWKCVCAYDGKEFSGWQSQPDAKTVQGTIEDALAEIFREPIRIHGTSRTDRGVHARGMVFHFDANWKATPRKLESALRRQLPHSIQVAPIERVTADFHARFSATTKQYRYFIHEGFADPFTAAYSWSYPRPLDTEAMKAAAKVLLGKHDFTSFAAYPGYEIETPVRHLQRLDIVRDGPKIIITTEADGFLYKMVRSLVGALVAVGSGKYDTDQIRAILQERKRTSLVVTAPPHGLFLEKVFYPEAGFQKRKLETADLVSR
ncbi:MAG TPA: tRNA pseudouridine(38-40) synthase TruA [Opitutales bacterium]|nr:tRNA pseudouridine(38-40) synthase TruA [Opitutales bacterium]